MEEGLFVSNKGILREWIYPIVIAILIVSGIRFLVVDHYRVDGSSMEPNIHTGERVVVNKLLYRLRHPERGEIIILRAPEGKNYIKRVIALPGETIKVNGDVVRIDGKKLDEPYLADAVAKAAKAGYTYNDLDYPDDDSIVTVPKDSVFVMGDNRSYSQDSRSIGFIKYKDVIGKAEFVFWPFSDAGSIGN